jgi:hypothetical protein
MSLSITQTPALVSLAQSPIIFTVAESVGVYESSSFQYVGELYYWTGSLTDSASVPQYTITKYPNSQNVGIFDLNRIINSTLTQYSQAVSSSVVYFAVDFYWQFQNASYVFETGSHVRSSTYKALDGYGIFQEAIGQEVYNKTPHWPLMSDGPVTQSAFTTNYGTMGVYVGDAGTTTPTKIVYTSALGSSDYSVSGGSSTTQQIVRFPIGPAESGFPLTGTIDSYKVQAYNNSTPLGTPITFDVVCTEKYPNIRIKWKNRYGQFDYMNFNMVNRQSFSTERKTYQPQLGSWEGSSLSYQNYDSANLAYIVDSKQAISVNTNWLPETYNEILKQLLVSDEIYWVQNESTDSVMPITITTQNIVFKTGVVDKLIQYQFEFNLGQPYKLIM